MRWRRPAIRSLFIVGGLTALATSSAEGDRLRLEETILYTGEETSFVVRVSEQANENASYIELQLSWPEFASDGGSVVIEPESELLEPLVIDPFAAESEGPSPIPDAALLRAHSYGYDLGAACPDAGPCELRFHVRPHGAAARARGELAITVLAMTPTEPGLCADQPDFPSGANLGIEEEP